LGREGSLMEVFVVQHAHEIEEDKEDVKFIGVYSTEESANAAVAGLSLQAGFRETSNGFHVDRYTVDEDHWTGGFITARTG
jgi:homoserine kinase type II